MSNRLKTYAITLNGSIAGGTQPSQIKNDPNYGNALLGYLQAKDLKEAVTKAKTLINRYGYELSPCDEKDLNYLEDVLFFFAWVNNAGILVKDEADNVGWDWNKFTYGCQSFHIENTADFILMK